MSQRLSLSGKRFGRLTVEGEAPGRKGFSYWRCVCDCGTSTVVKGHSLNSGGSLSCGCLRTDMARKALTKHGMTQSPEFKIWVNMTQRCLNPRNSNWKKYGAKGVRVCARWRASFLAFFSDMGRRPSGRSLDRINSSGNYAPSNCRWATSREQRMNRRPKAEVS